MNELIIAGILAGIGLVAVAIDSAADVYHWAWRQQSLYYKRKNRKNRGVYAWEIDWSKWQ